MKKMLQTLEQKMKQFPGMEITKTYKRWFPSTPVEMPSETPIECPYKHQEGLEFNIICNERLRLYCGGISKEPIVKPSYNGIIIPHPQIDGLPSLHDTYKIDRYDNLYNYKDSFSFIKKEAIIRIAPKKYPNQP